MYNSAIYYLRMFLLPQIMMRYDSIVCVYTWKELMAKTELVYDSTVD